MERFERSTLTATWSVRPGTYSVQDDVVTILWQQGLGITPGSTNVLGWNVYRDSRTFSAVPGGEPLLALTIKPFTRVG